MRKVLALACFLGVASLAGAQSDGKPQPGPPAKPSPATPPAVTPSQPTPAPPAAVQPLRRAIASNIAARRLASYRFWKTIADGK